MINWETPAEITGLNCTSQSDLVEEANDEETIPLGHARQSLIIKRPESRTSRSPKLFPSFFGSVGASVRERRRKPGNSRDRELLRRGVFAKLLGAGHVSTSL
jgi:hypothetical protein